MRCYEGWGCDVMKSGGAMPRGVGCNLERGGGAMSKMVGVRC